VVIFGLIGLALFGPIGLAVGALIGAVAGLPNAFAWASSRIMDDDEFAKIFRQIAKVDSKEFYEICSNQLNAQQFDSFRASLKKGGLEVVKKFDTTFENNDEEGISQEQTSYIGFGSFNAYESIYKAFLDATKPDAPSFDIPHEDDSSSGEVYNDSSDEYAYLQHDNE
jgi:hypothetical protein